MSNEIPIHTPQTFGDVAKTDAVEKEIEYANALGMTFLDLVALAPPPVATPTDAGKAGGRPQIKRILSGDGANLIIASFLPGQALRDHKAAHPITVSCLQGELDFGCGEDTVTLRPGCVVHLPARVVHRVDCRIDGGVGEDGARRPSVMLLTMLTS